MKTQRSLLPWILFTLVGGGISLGLLLYSPLATAGPTVNWTPSAVTQAIAPGQSKTTSVSFVASGNISNTVVQIVPELQPFVQATPTTFASLVKGQTYNMNLAVSAAADSHFAVFDGTVQLRSGTSLKTTFSKPLPITISVEPPGLPPDPGEAGKATLEGIDSDGDGVRDDIQRYIALTYQDSEKLRAALTEMAKNRQKALVDANDSNKSYQHAIKDQSAYECLAFLHLESSHKISQLLFAEILNTEERSHAYLLYNSQFRGRAFDINLPSKSSCGFDPDTLEN